MPNSIAIGISNLLMTLQNQRVVFAESCTGGMAAALMTQVPGISDYFCGSAVTYRESTKQQWLDVAADTLHRHSAESQQTTDELAVNVLKNTTEATIACAVTGHLGPGAASDVDGIVFISIAERVGDGYQITETIQQSLKSKRRIDRQLEAAELLLNQLQRHLSGMPK